MYENIYFDIYVIIILYVYRWFGQEKEEDFRLQFIRVTVHTYGVGSSESGLFQVALRQEAGFLPR